MPAQKRHRTPKIGDAFGLWTVTGPLILSRRGRLVPCRCSCGTEKLVCLVSLVTRHSRNCRRCTGIRRGPSFVLHRFWKMVRKTKGCWLWTGALTDKGYGNFWDGEGYRSAHAFSWEIANGRPMQFQGNHTCDNRKCVNPSHVYDGTQKQNMMDASRRGRLGRRGTK